jgi:hypothetical protein
MSLKHLKSTAVAALLALGAATSQAGVLLSEGFDDITTLPGAGWVQTNNSTLGGTTGWFQGNGGVGGVFDAAAGGPNSYIAANFNNATFGGAISNWLMTPTVQVSNGETLNFALRLLGGVDPTLLLDTVEVYLSTSGSSSNVGASTSSTGDFSLLQTFSSSTDTGWVNESITVGGLGAPGTGRFAFRYVVANTITDGSYIGIDTVNITDNTNVPEPTSLALVGLGIAGLAATRRRRGSDTEYQGD